MGFPRSGLTVHYQWPATRCAPSIKNASSPYRYWGLCYLIFKHQHMASAIHAPPSERAGRRLGHGPPASHPDLLARRPPRRGPAAPCRTPPPSPGTPWHTLAQKLPATSPVQTGSAGAPTEDSVGTGCCATARNPRSCRTNRGCQSPPTAPQMRWRKAKKPPTPARTPQAQTPG